MRLLILLGCAALLAAAERLPGVPPVNELIEGLCSSDQQTFARAAALVNLVDDSDLPALRERVLPAGNLGTYDFAVLPVLIARGDAETLVKLFKNHLHYFSSTDDELWRVLDHLTAEELRPLADAMERQLAAETKTLSVSGSPWHTWMELAVRTRHDALSQRLRKFIGACSPEVLAQMGPRFPPGSEDLLGGMLSAKDPARRLGALRLLRGAWQTMPMPAVAELAQDPDPAVRRMFTERVQGSHLDVAVPLLAKLLRDKDSEVCQAAMASLSRFPLRDPRIKAQVAEFARDQRADPAVRAWCWNALAGLPDDTYAEAARSLVEAADGALIVRQAALAWLAKHEQSPWILARLTTLPADLRPTAIQFVLRANQPGVLEKVADMIRTAPDATAAAMVSALSSGDPESTIPLVITLLADPRAPVSQAAANSLRNLSHTSLPAHLGSGARAILAWKAWYARSLAPCAPEIASAAAQLRKLCAKSRTASNSIGTFPPEVLMRLVDDPQCGAYALAGLGETKASDQLLSLVDAPVFVRHQQELTTALLQAGPSDAARVALKDWIGSEHANLRQLAITLLVGWRQQSELLVKPILEEGWAFPEVATDLALWPDNAVLLKARKLLADRKADPAARQRAVALLVLAKDDRDVKGLSIELGANGPGAASAASGLVAMMAGGSADAATLLTHACGNTRKPEVQRLVLSALQQQANDPELKAPPVVGDNVRVAVIKLGTSVRASGAAATASPPLHELAFAVLSAWGEPRGLALWERYLTPLDSEGLRHAIDVVTQTQQRAARPYVEAVMEHPRFNATHLQALSRWLERVIGLTPADIAALAKPAAAPAAAAPAAVRERTVLEVTILTPAVILPRGGNGVEQPDAQLSVRIRNTSKQQICLADTTLVTILLNGTKCQAVLHLGNGPVVKLKAGATVQGEIAAALSGPDPMAGLGTLVWDWREVADPKPPAGARPTGALQSGTATSQSIPMLVASPLLLEVEKRHGKAQP